MFDDLFRRNNEPSKQEQESLEDVRSNSHVCAGNVLSDSAYQTLMNLAIENFNPDDVFHQTAEELQALLHPCESDVNLFIVNSDAVRGIFHDYVEREGELSYKKAETLFNILRSAYDQLFCSVNHFIDEQNGNYTGIACQVALSFLSQKADLLIPVEKGACQTCVRNFANTLFNGSSWTFKQRFVSARKDFQLTGMDRFPRKVFQEDWFTTISPGVLHSIVKHLDSVRAKFLETMPKPIYEKDEVINELFDFEESRLSYANNVEGFSIESDRQDIVLTWGVPSFCSRQVVDNKEKLEIMISPVRELLREMAGDLNLDVDKDRITMTIKCPYQDPPKVIKDVHDSTLVSPYCKGLLPFSSDNTSNKLFILDNGKIFDLIIEGGSLSNESQRYDASNVINGVGKFKTEKPLTSVTLPTKGSHYLLCFGEGPDKTTIKVPQFVVGDKDLFEDICKVVDGGYCASLTYLSKIPEVPEGSITAINNVLRKLAEQNEGRFNVKFEIVEHAAPVVSVRNSNDQSIAYVQYLPEMGCYAGAVESPERIIQVLKACDEIIEKQRAENLDASMTRFIMNEFCDKLADYNIHTTSDYVDYQRNLLLEPGAREYMDNDDLYTYLRAQIAGGFVIIDQQDGKIILDCAEPGNYRKMLERHKIL